MHPNAPRLERVESWSQQNLQHRDEFYDLIVLSIWKFGLNGVKCGTIHALQRYGDCDTL